MKTTVSTATAAGTAALAFVVVLVWALSFAHVTVPADVATAIATLITAAVHYLVAAHVLPSVPVTLDGKAEDVTPPTNKVG